MSSKTEITESHLPCPFCGSGASDHYMDKDAYGFNRVTCRQCGAIGAGAATPYCALFLWNARAEIEEPP